MCVHKIYTHISKNIYTHPHTHEIKYIHAFVVIYLSVELKIPHSILLDFNSKHIAVIGFVLV